MGEHQGSIVQTKLPSVNTTLSGAQLNEASEIEPPPAELQNALPTAMEHVPAKKVHVNRVSPVLVSHVMMILNDDGPGLSAHTSQFEVIIVTGGRIVGNMGDAPLSPAASIHERCRPSAQG
jgi:hypothetical protein